MNLAQFGVSIDPTAAESGAVRANAASASVGKGITNAATAWGSASRSIDASAGHMADSAETAANTTAASAGTVGRGISAAASAWGSAGRAVVASAQQIAAGAAAAAQATNAAAAGMGQGVDAAAHLWLVAGRTIDTSATSMALAVRRSVAITEAATLALGQGMGRAANLWLTDSRIIDVEAERMGNTMNATASTTTSAWERMRAGAAALMGYLRNAFTGVGTTTPAFAQLADNATQNIQRIPKALDKAAGSEAWEKLKGAAGTLMGDLGQAFQSVAMAAGMMGSQFGMLLGVVMQIGFAFVKLAGSLFTYLTTQKGASKAAVEGAEANAALALSEEAVGVSAAAATGGLLAFLVALGPLALALAGLVAVLAALGAGFVLMKDGIKQAAEVEVLTKAIANLSGSTATASKVMAQLRKDSETTGIALTDQAATVRRFIGLGFEPDKAVALNKSLLDIAGTFGLTADEAKLLGAALGQVQSKGVASMEELRQQIAEKGIPVFQALATHVGVTQAALQKMVADGKISAKQVIDTFLNFDGAFAKARGGAALMGETWTGLMGRIKAAWENLLSDFGTPIMGALKPMLIEFLGLIQSMQPLAKEIGTAIATAITGIHAAIEVMRGEGGLQLAWDAAVESLSNGLRRTFEAAGSQFEIIMAKAGATLISAFNEMQKPAFWAGMSDALYNAAVEFKNELMKGLREAYNFINDNLEKIPGFAGGAAMKGQFDSSWKPQAYRNTVAGEQAGPPRDAMTMPTWGEAYNRTATGSTESADKFKAKWEEAEAKLRAMAKGTPMKETGMAKTEAEDDIPVAKKATAEWKKLQHEAESVIKGIQTPAEKLKETMDQLETLKSAGLLTEEQFARGTQKASADYVKALEEMAEKSRTPMQKLIRQWTDLKKTTGELAVQMTQAVGNDMAGAFTDLAMGTKSAKEAFSDMANSILRDITAMIIKMLIEYAIGAAMGYFTGTPTGGATTGKGVAGASKLGGSTYKSGTGAKFAYGGAVGSGDKPISAEKGEVVLTRDKADDIKRRMGEAAGQAQDKKGQNLVILNLQSMQEVEQHLVQNPSVVVNIISQNARAVKRALEAR